MNLANAAIVLRHRRPLEVVELALVFARGLKPGVTGRLSALVLLPIFLASLLLRYRLDWPWPWVLSVAWVATWLAELPFVVFAGRVLFDREVTTKQVLRESLGRAAAFFLVTVFEIGVIILLLPTAVGPLFGMASYCFAREAVTLERASASQALKRARSLQRGRSGTGVQTIFLKTCLAVACVLAVEIFGQATWSFVLDIEAESESLMDAGGSPFALLGLMLSVPVTCYYRFLSYINERTELDGWDVQIALLALRRKDSNGRSAEAA